MKSIPRHLNDEHMQLYEWSGAGTGMLHALPARSKRNHPWQASNAVLALLASLLIVAAGHPAAKAGERIGRGAHGEPGGAQAAAQRAEPSTRQS